MTKNLQVPKLHHAGYLILRRPEDASFGDERRRGIAGYFGLDRLPLIVAADPAIRAAVGAPPIHDAKLRDLTDEWFDARFGNTAFIPTHHRAMRLLKGFRSFGLEFELVYCHLACSDGEEDRLAAYETTAEAAPEIVLTYGFDVSWPTCTHSAILQPGVVSCSPHWRDRLNGYGLLDDYLDAVTLRAEYLAVYPYAPFDTYAVHKIEQE